MKINRAELLEVLESVQPGLTLKDVVEQSSCFVFENGRVMTFNDEVACRRMSPLKITGAVPAVPFLSILRKLPGDSFEVTLNGDELVIRDGKGRKTGLRTQSEVALPYEKVDKASDWKPLNEDFADAVFVTHQCTDKDESNYMGSCLHIHPKFIEACDNSQAIRYKIKTGVREPMLVRGTSIKHIVDLGMTEFCETESWIHFRNPNKLYYSCRRDPQAYESLEDTLNVSGAALTLPKGLSEAAEIAEVFSSENADENEVKVEIRPGRLRVVGDGVSGWASVIKKLKYHGKPIEFFVGPKLLVELVKRYNDCEITSDRLKVDSGKFVYVVALGSTEKDKESQNEAETESEEE